jgi:hypothetical protein
VARTAEEQIGVPLPEDKDEVEVQPTPAQLEAERKAEEEAAAEPERPEWLPEIFSTPEDMAKSWTESQQKITEFGQRLAEIEQGQQEPQYQQEPAFSQDDFQEGLYEQYAEDPLKVTAYMAQQAALATYQQMEAARQAQLQPQQQTSHELAAFAADQMMAETYSDWQTVKDDVVRVLQSDPGILREEDARSLQGTRAALTRAYQIAQYNRMSQEAEQAGLTQAQAEEAMKQNAQTLSGASARPAEPSAQEQKIAELKQAIKGASYSAIRSNSAG